MVQKTTFPIFSSAVEFPCEVQYATGGFVVELVVTDNTLLEAEAFPAASLAFTEKLYVVEAVNPVMEADVDAVFPNNVAPLYTS